MDTKETISAEERQRQLNKIARDYMRGTMDLETFAAAEEAKQRAE